MYNSSVGTKGAMIPFMMATLGTLNVYAVKPNHFTYLHQILIPIIIIHKELQPAWGINGSIRQYRRDCRQYLVWQRQKIAPVKHFLKFDIVTTNLFICSFVFFPLIERFVSFSLLMDLLLRLHPNRFLVSFKLRTSVTAWKRS